MKVVQIAEMLLMLAAFSIVLTGVGVIGVATVYTILTYY